MSQKAGKKVLDLSRFSLKDVRLILQEVVGDRPTSLTIHFGKRVTNDQRGYLFLDVFKIFTGHPLGEEARQKFKTARSVTLTRQGPLSQVDGTGIQFAAADGTVTKYINRGAAGVERQITSPKGVTIKHRSVFKNDNWTAPEQI